MSGSCPPGPVEGDSDAHTYTAWAGMGSGKEGPGVFLALSPAAGASVRQPQGSYFGPSYVNRSPAGSWHEHT